MARFLLRHDWVGILLSHVCTLLSVYGPDLSASQRRLVLGHFEVDADLVLPRWRLIFSLRRWRERVLEEPALRMMLAAYRLQIWPARSRRLKINATAGFPTAARQTRVDPPPCHSPQTSSKAQTRK